MKKPIILAPLSLYEAMALKKGWKYPPEDRGAVIKYWEWICARDLRPLPTPTRRRFGGR